MELKPCPFCGSEARIVTNYVGSVYIRCTNIYKCGVRQEGWDMEEDAIEAWNRRAGEADGIQNG